MAELWMKRGDLLPRVESTLKDGAGNRVDIAGRDVTFVMRAIRGTEPVIEAAAANDQVDDDTAGDVHFDWVDGDTDIAGGFYSEWLVDFDGKPMRFPNSEHDTIAIVESLAEAGS